MPCSNMFKVTIRKDYISFSISAKENKMQGHSNAKRIFQLITQHQFSYLQATARAGVGKY